MNPLCKTPVDRPAGAAGQAARAPAPWLALAFGLVLALTLWVTPPAEAVVLDDDNQLTVTLADGTSVTLFGEAGRQGRKTRNYYYLPAQLRLAQRADTTPEFLFLSFTTEEREDAGGASGALLHFLMTWGLTPDQETELREVLQSEHRGAKLKGAVPLEEGEDGGSFRIISATLSDDEMTRSLVTSGRAPLVPGGKAAAASRLDANGAQLMAASFEKTRSIADLSIALDFKYSTLTPAARGSIVFDWSKWESEYDSLEANYKKWVSGKKTKSILGFTYSSKPLYSYSYDEMHAHYEYLFEKQVVRLEFEELVADERVSKIREAFFQYFLDTFTQSTQDEVPPPPGEDEADQVPNIRHGQSYKYKKTFHERSFSRKIMRFDLNYRMSIRRPFQLVGNLASWYDHVKDNPKCVGTVNLNNPFFEHRDVHFILDLEAKDIFDDVINYATVNVRKDRSKGRDFSTSVTLDKKHLEDEGIRASVTYSRGEDENPDAYEYAVQWSLRGGNVVPESPDWQPGDWQGVTLTPPVEARLFEVEGDLGEMEDSDITRATVQVRYYQFGEEKEANIHLSPSRGEPLVEERLFVDRGTRGVVTRLIFNHKTEGKLVLGWSPLISDNYLFAQIPEELLEEGSDLREKAKEAGAKLAETAGEKVLEQFEALLEGGGS